MTTINRYAPCAGFIKETVGKPGCILLRVRSVPRRAVICPAMYSIDSHKNSFYGGNNIERLNKL